MAKGQALLLKVRLNLFLHLVMHISFDQILREEDVVVVIFKLLFIPDKFSTFYAIKKL